MTDFEGDAMASTSVDGLRRVLRIVAGSPEGAAADAAGLADVESGLGTALPRDYVDFISTYGAGNISDFAWIACPATPARSKGAPPSVKSATDAFRNSAAGDDFWPAGRLPVKDLIQWGGDDGANNYLWHSNGADPDKWPVVIALHGLTPVVCDFGMIEYLRRACEDLLAGPIRGLRMGPDARFLHWQEYNRLFDLGVDPWTGERHEYS
ncbi:hypothetical protein F4556_006826 [Kitasatospora gansuensis]|uniref:Knr4/Smi1-like domain-containing protein n=1 Tax=Kitasatospora gansuensis TaxID=258050 RepID=A0A7W7SIV9_9ACTN|nr:hypothetical protein [Kitasatospora gansuensis]MBB4951291.1 hypothetical protein [Kitasatospora gansuensis]